MKSPVLDPTAALVVDHIEKTINAHEANQARLTILWMIEFFASKFVTIRSASRPDVQAFCDERAKTRKASSMVRLIVIVKLIFRTLVGLRLRVDDPTIGLAGPPAEISFVKFDIDDALVLKLLDGQRSIIMRASKRTLPKQTRRLAILSFAAAGAFCTEISTLDFDDVSLTLASMKYVRVGRFAANERDLLLGGDGTRAVNDYLRLRGRMSLVKSSALFVSHHSPFRRLSPESISGEISHAIAETGLKGLGISPAALHRSAPGSALKAGLGGRVAGALGGYRSPPNAKPEAASAMEMSDLIERHHPMSRLDL